MNARRRCLLVALLALVARPAFAAPGAATLVAPSGDVVGTSIAFSWQAVPESTWYLFWLGKGTPPSFVLEQWYTAEQAGCANGGTCTITITPPINAGVHIWFVQTWGAGLTGPWSTGKVFVLKDPTPNWSAKLSAERRFTLVLDGEAALDNETGLVWQRTPASNQRVWAPFVHICAYTSIGGRYGFRSPTFSELMTLVDTNQTPYLPPEHPFNLGMSGNEFWSETSAVDDATSAWGIDVFGMGYVAVKKVKTQTARSWCVRGPTGAKQ